MQMIYYKALSTLLLIGVRSVTGQVNPNCLHVNHSCRSATQECTKIKQETCNVGDSLMETVRISAEICNFSTGSLNINNPDSFIRIQGPAVQNPINLSSEIILPFPDGVTHLSFGDCIIVEDFEMQIDKCLSGFTYEVKMITGTQCGGERFVVAMQRICPFHTAISCTIIENEVPCASAHTMGYTGSSCIQNLRYDFTYSSHVGDENGDILFIMDTDPLVGSAYGQYSSAKIDGNEIGSSAALFSDISIGEEHSFWYIAHDVNVCQRIPDASIQVLATASDPTSLSRRFDYLVCSGSTDYDASSEGWKPPVASPVPPITDPFPDEPSTFTPSSPVKTPKSPKKPSIGRKRRKSDDIPNF